MDIRIRIRFKVDVKMDISEFDLQTRIRIRISEFWADSDVKADNIRIRETVSTASTAEIPGFQPRAPAQLLSRARCSISRLRALDSRAPAPWILNR
jgi:hypothetical protein